MLAGDDRGIDAAHVINILNLIDRSFSNAQIFLLVPLQTVYPKNGEQKQGASNEDYILRLSSHLHTLTKSTLPAWDKIFSQAEDVLKTIQEKDSEYYEHMTTVIKEGMLPVDVHSFAYEILVKGQKKSNKVWNELEKKKRRNWKVNELEIFGDVAIYLRKWISEAFVGIFSTPTILFVWDYLFMNNWKCMRKLCIVILSLLRPWAMRAKSQRELVRVFSEEPSKIYLQDLRKGLVKYDRDNIDTIKISSCNTNIEIVVPEEKEEKNVVDENGKESTTTDENNDANKDDKNEGDNKDDTQTGNSENVGGDETKENKVEDDAGSNKTEDAPEIEDNLKKNEEGENPDTNKE